MQTRTSLGVLRATFLATLGIAPLVACSNSSSASNGTDAGTGGTNTGGMSATGGSATGGNGAGGSGGTGAIQSSGGLSGGGDGGQAQSSGGLSGAGARDAGGDSGDASDSGSSVCKNPHPRLGPDGQPTGYIDCEGGFTHRPQKKTCASGLPRAGTCGSGAPIDDAGLHNGECSKDTDCTGANAYCETAALGLGGSCFCNNGCTTDADCGTGEICGCGDPIGICVPTGNCAVDADCGPGFLCISSKDAGGCNATFGCQAATDTCVTDADCVGDAANGTQICAFVTDHHECAPMHLCGTGRPFLVGGAARVANLAANATWQSDVRPETRGLADATRETLATRWTEIALMEHASVAAFARFALELMSLGAPPELLVATQSAMADETLHARHAFALASAYADAPVGPGLLDVERALGSRTPLDIVRTAVLEGCIGETVAAVEAMESLSRATDPAVRAVLSRIAEDETKHAELAWHFVQWVIESGPAELRVPAARELVDVVNAEIRKRGPATAAPRQRDEVLGAHGILDASEKEEISRRVLVEVVEPCAAALARSAGSKVRSETPHLAASRMAI